MSQTLKQDSKTKTLKGSLGIFTKFQAKSAKTLDLSRVHEFLLQDQSCEILKKNKLPHRVSNCLKKRIDKTKNRKVSFNESRCKAHYTNIQRCGAVWVCPVCAKQITEKRRNELSQGIQTFKDMNADKCDIKMLTLTFSHALGMPLRFLLDGLKLAIEKFYAHRTFKTFSKEISVVGKIRAFELTYGKNGWHPHFHILFLSHDVDHRAYEYKNKLIDLWKKCCVDAGLKSPSSQHGLDIRDGEFAEKYVSKWGIEYEMSKGHVKKGREGGLTPFDLIQLSFLDIPTYGGRTPSSLFAEYVVCSKGRAQLQWQRGLKKILLIDDKTDEELAQETENQGIEICDVPEIIFYLLRKYQKRHVFLECIENDWVNGSFGSGTAEELIIDCAQKEIDSFNSEYNPDDAKKLSEFMSKLQEIYS